MSEAVDQEPRLRRVMGPGLLLLFIIGDILGTGVYALIGDVAAEVGGAAWVPFLLAFVIAAITALSYLELVTKYPQAAGAALYAQKAFNKPFVTFVVAFVVMCAGITSAATASRFFAANFFTAFQFSWGTAGYLLVALLFIVVLGAVNLRGVGQSLRLNVVLSVRCGHRTATGHRRGDVGVRSAASMPTTRASSPSTPRATRASSWP